MFKLYRLVTSKHLRSALKAKQRLDIVKEFSSLSTPEIKLLPAASSSRIDQIRLSLQPVNSFHTHSVVRKKQKDEVEAYDEKQSLLYYPEFARWEKKDKKTFLETVRVYRNNVKNRAGHVDFIKAALKHMKEYNVHRDLECYKQLIEVLPKGVYVCTNKFMVDGMYYPRQQFVALSLLDQMSENGVWPDDELGFILADIFGEKSHPCSTYKQMLYWSLKWKNKTPFVLPRPLPSDALLLAKLAIERITSVDLQTEISVFQTNKIQESRDETWIVSAQSPKQKKLLANHPQDIPVIVEGGDIVHLIDKSVNYFVLKSDGEPLPVTPPEDNDEIGNLESKYFNPNYIAKEGYTVHEQDDGIIYGVCATGTSSKDSLLSWVRILESTGNPILAKVPVLFRFKQPEKLPAVQSEELVRKEDAQL